MSEMQITNKNKIKRGPGDTIFNVIIYTFMIVLMFVTVYPLVYCLFASFSDAKQLLNQTGPIWWPIKPYTIQGYILAFRNVGITIGFRNTITYVLGGTAIGLTLTALGAFCLSRKYFLVRGILMKIIMFTMFFSGGIIPLFFVVQELHIYDTWWAFVLPYAMSTYNLIIMRTFFMGIPDSLEEAALIDGANELQIFIRIYLPLSTAVIAVIAMYYGVGYWNAWYQALMFIRDRNLYPLQMFLREVLITEQAQSTAKDVTSQSAEAFTRELVKYCIVIISTVPILVVYPFLQRYFVKGVMIGAIKG